MYDIYVYVLYCQLFITVIYLVEADLYIYIYTHIFVNDFRYV